MMIACDSCFETHGCGLPTSLKASSGRRQNVASLLGDPLWKSIQTEASADAAQEPFLRPLLEKSIIQRRSFGEGLAMILSQRLLDPAMKSLPFYKELCDVIDSDIDVAASARNDLLAIRTKDPATESLLHPLLNFKGFHAIQAHRIAHSLWKDNRRAMAYYMQSRVSEVLGVDIHPAATIGTGVFIDHATGVVIGETAVVGTDVTIMHGVTLGGTGKEGGDRHPKIGRGVFIGANAQLLGNIKIGEGARIGASSVVLKSVESYSTVAGVPAEVVNRKRRPDLSTRA